MTLVRTAEDVHSTQKARGFVNTMAICPSTKKLRLQNKTCEICLVKSSSVPTAKILVSSGASAACLDMITLVVTRTKVENFRRLIGGAVSL